MKISVIVCSVLLIFMTACSSTPRPQNYANIGTELSESEYKDLILKNTQEDKQYEGLYNKFQLHAALVKSDIATAILQRKSETFLWDQRQAQKQREKQFQELSSETKLVVSFFTPKQKHNDLSKGNSMWRVYLEVDGERYEGKVQKLGLKYIESKRLYPFHNRWSEIYEVSFPLPTSSIDSAQAKVTFTSSLGSSTIKF